MPDYQAAEAQDDQFTIDELTLVTGDLFADNGWGIDSDPDGPALTVSEVNGSSFNVGTQIILASGALLTVNADGTFSYDPNGAFEYTPTVGSGASNTPSYDSFTYTLAGGDTATVNLTITGIDNNDVLIGTAGNDVLTGGAGNDAIYGLAGDDLIRGRAGDDLIDGGDGFDRAGYYHVNEALGGVTVDLNIAGPQDTGSQGWDTLTSIEYVSGTPFADTLIGDASDNILWGSTATIDPDSNWISTSNNDTLDGGGGNDLLYVGIGNHSLTGGDGNDTVGFTENFGDDPAIRISLALQGAAQDTGQGLWTLNGIENLSGGNDDDELTGDGNDNILAGSFGNDTLSGGGGNDTLYGDGAIDSGAPSSGPPTLYPDVGANGNDTLEGGLGDDQLYGGGGSDTASYAHAPGGVTAFLYKAGDGNGEASGADGNDTLVGIENLTGSAFNDVLIGNNLDNIIDGGDGHDLLRGNGGNDTLLGGDGDDYLDGGIGDDVLDGGAGFDRLSYFGSAIGPVSIDLRIQGVAQDTGQGMDTLIGIEHVGGTVYGDTLTGDDGDNWLRGSSDGAGNDILDGQGGNDLIEDGAGDHVLDGGEGIDTFLYAPTTSGGINVSLALQGAAQDTGVGMMTLNGFENLSGSFQADTLTGDGGDNILAGSGGDDILAGGAGSDTLYGDGAFAIDTHETLLSGPIILQADTGAAGNDTLDGGDGDDQLFGGGGSDTASYASASGAVQLFLYNGSFGEAFGAAGYDQLHDMENLTGSAYDDTLGGNNLDNVLDGGDGHDFLRGNAGSDTLYAGDGNDYLSGGVGDDYLDGGDGWDRVSFFAGATGGVTVDLRIAGAQDTGLGIDTLVNIENVSGTAFSDTLTGNDGDNQLWGTSDGDGGNDTLDGQGGNDLLEDGAGDHTLIGGTGVDTFSYSILNSTIGINVSLALQGAAQDTGVGLMTLSEIENLSGSIYADNLIGDGGDNLLAGGLGDDTLVGGAGNDTLYGDGSIGIDGNGGSGPITLYTDADTASGEVAGNDLLEGGVGDDILWGGGGNDTASYASASGGVQVALYNSGFGEAFGAAGYDQLHDIENLVGSTFNDTLTGNNSNNILTGGDGHDGLRGRGGNDTLYGGNGDDFLNGGLGDDLIDGGGGYDRAAFYTDATAGVTVDLNLQGVAQNTGQGMDTLVGIENLSGTAFGDTLIGDEGDNVLWGSPATLIDGSISAANNDTLLGNGGNDLLIVGIGNHSLTGGSGVDTVSFTENGAPETAVTVSLDLQGAAQSTGNGSWTLTGIENLSGGTAGDTLTGDGSNNVLAGYTGNDTLVGGGGNDTLYGDGQINWDPHGTGGSGPITTFADVALLDPTLVDGNDVLEGGDGNDQLYGGGGSDTASYEHAGGGVSAGLGVGGSGGAGGAAGSDTFYSIENLTGSAYNDQFGGNADANILSGGDGHDILAGRAGNDTVIGGAGDDYLRGDDGDDIIDGGSGWDRVAYSIAISGVTIDLNIQGVAQNTGQGWDTLINIEHASGSAFNDTIIGNSGDNWLRSWGGNDTILGGDGNDLIETMPGNNTIDGGNGIDSWSFYGDGTFILGPVNVSLALQGAAQDTGQGVMLATGFENLSGSIYGDTLAGDGGANVIAGDQGNDTLSGGAGNDVLYGDGRILIDWHGNGGSGPITTFADMAASDPAFVDGNDVLEGGLGNDAINGGGGTDTASYANAAGAVTVNLATGITSGADGNDTLSSIENVIGSAFNDTITGDATNNLLIGGAGNDSLNGGEGADTFVGGIGNDALNGGNGVDTIDYSASSAGVSVNLSSGKLSGGDAAGDTISSIENIIGSASADKLIGSNLGNVLNGGSGNDTITGGAGADTLFGGSGSDSFMFVALTDFGSAANPDWINDFDAGGSTAATRVDLIDLSAIDANSKSATKDDAFTFIGSAQFSNKAGQLRYDAATSTLSGDVNGDGIADFSLKLVLLGTLDSSDFIL
jgi:Ca2+-binding RTX toxin-like protein